MARTPNIPQKFGSVGDGLLYEALYQFQRAIQQGGLQGRKQGTTVQAAVTINVDNPVIRIVGSAAIKTINARGFGQPIYFYAQDGVTFSSSGGNVRTDATLGAGDSAIAQYDSEKDEWFIVGGGGPPIVGYVTDGSNVGGGAEVFKAKVGTILEHRTLKATGVATVTQNADDVTLHVPAPASISVGSEEIAYGDGSGGVTSEPAFKYKASTNTQTVDTVNFKRPLVNVKHATFGAVGDGVTDDTDAIQAAIDYAATLGAGALGATVYFPTGTYIIGKTNGTSLDVKDKVSLMGENRSTSQLWWKPTNNHVGVPKAILNTVNYIRDGTRIEDLYLASTDPTNKPAIGILGGSYGNIGYYNSGNALFRNLTIYDCDTGILGDGAGYGTHLGVPTVGIFDSLFDDISLASCGNGVNLLGSGNVFIKPFVIATHSVGFVFDCLSSDSRAGYSVYGGTFTQNAYDIYFVDSHATGQELRPTNFFGTWFEASTQGISSVPADIRVPMLNFQGCLLQSDHTAGNPMLDVAKILGVVGVDECTLMRFSSGVGGQNITIQGNPAKNRLVIRDCTAYDNRGAGWQWYYTGTDAAAHLTKFAALGQALPIGTTTITWDLAGAGGAGWFDRESCCNATTYTALYAGTYSVATRVCIENDAAVAGYAELRIEKSGTPIAIQHQDFAAVMGSKHHLVCTANVDLVVGDTILVSVFNNIALHVIDNPAGFANAHYNTFSVTREF